jgi:hypothetical protein
MVSWLQCFGSEVRQDYHGGEQSRTAHLLAVTGREEREKEGLLPSINLQLPLEQ